MWPHRSSWKSKTRKGGRILIHRFDAEGLYDPSISLTDQVGLNVPELEIASRVDDNDIIHIGNIEFKVIHTPGHTKEVALYIVKQKICYFLAIQYLKEHGEEQICQQAILKT